MTDDTEADALHTRTWVKRQHLEDGWHIRCDLCGKPFSRKFSEDRSEHPKGAAGDAADYVGEHLESAAHLAAIAAYRDLPQEPPDSAEVALLHAIFGEPMPAERTTEQLRMSAARRAASRVRRGRTA